LSGSSNWRRRFYVGQVNKRWSVFLLSSLAFATTICSAEQAKPDEDEFELAGTDVEVWGDGGPLDLSDTGFVGNPMSSISGGWPEDLVIAPIPGRSPQIGWNLTLAGGYFFDNDDAEGEDGGANTRRSAIGGFAMIAENGSYAYGAGANLHLLDDKLRVKAGAAFADIRPVDIEIERCTRCKANIVGDITKNGSSPDLPASVKLQRNSVISVRIFYRQAESARVSCCRKNIA
jgi:hypothetical protein